LFCREVVLDYTQHVYRAQHLFIPNGLEIMSALTLAIEACSPRLHEIDKRAATVSGYASGTHAVSHYSEALLTLTALALVERM
jgi:hypothetical protein